MDGKKREKGGNFKQRKGYPTAILGGERKKTMIASPRV